MRAWRAIVYVSCPLCGCGSVATRVDGRIARHSVGCGSVERVRPPMATVVCRGSILSMRVAWAWARAAAAASDEGRAPPVWDRRRALADSRRG